jgi:hypothetical protein
MIASDSRLGGSDRVGLPDRNGERFSQGESLPAGAPIRRDRPNRVSRLEKANLPAMELVAESGLLASLEIVEVNPILDRQNATAAHVVELAASAFGATTI